MSLNDNWETHWSSLQEGATLNSSVKYRQALILRCIKSLPYRPKCVLDIGSGTGDLIQSLVDHAIGEERIGIELSASGVASAQRKAPSALFFQGDMYSAPAALKNFESRADLILCSEVIEHLDDPLTVLRNIKKYLSPSGKMVLTVPGGPLHEFGRMIGHRQHFTKVTISELLEKGGFFVEKVYLAGFPFFNLHRLICTLRGKKLYEDAANVSSIYRIANSIFNILLGCTWDNSPFGWQIVAIASHA